MEKNKLKEIWDTITSSPTDAQKKGNPSNASVGGNILKDMNEQKKNQMDSSGVTEELGLKPTKKKP